MKKKYLFLVLLALAFVLMPFIAFAQIYSPTWGTTGNTVKTGQFLGSKNNQDVIFKTNNINVLNLKANGDIVFPNLTNAITGKYLTTDVNGKLQLASATNYDDVLTFNSLVNFPASGTNGVLYIASDTGLTYIWNNLNYTQTTTSSTTPFYLKGTTIDAGTNKTTAIYRNGFIGINEPNPNHGVDIKNTQLRAFNGNTTNQFLIDPMDVVGPKIKLGTTADPISFFEFGSYNSKNNFDNKARDFHIFGNSHQGLCVKNNGFVGIGTTSPSSNLHISSYLTSTASINASAKIITLSRPDQSNFKWGNKVEFNLGSYSSAINANTRLDLSLNDTDANSTLPVMTWLANKNVGIGTTAPTALLHLLTSSSARLLFETTDGSSGQASIDLKAGNYQHWRILGQGSANSGRFDIHNQTTNSTALTVLPNNYFGVNTTNPVSRFTVNDNTYINSIPQTSLELMNNSTFRPLSRLQITSGVNNNAISSYLTTSTAALQVHNYSTGQTLPFSINPVGGNVGIGIVNPQYNLDVRGSTQVDLLKFKTLIPTQNNDPGEPGEIRVDEEYIYVCFYPNKWRRVLLSDF